MLRLGCQFVARGGGIGSVPGIIGRKSLAPSSRIHSLDPPHGGGNFSDTYSGTYRRVDVRFNHNQALIRNVGIVAHIDAGKTTTSEQMLFKSGQINYVGRVDSGDTVMDFLPQERERGITISSAAVTLPWKNHQINLIDTPGHVDFTIEVERACRVLDGVVLVVDAVAGVQAQTQTVWKQTRRQSIPAVAFVNKMDRDGASFARTISSIKKKLGANAVPIQLPVGSEESFEGVIDLIAMNKLTWKSKEAGIPSTRNPAPPTIEPLSKDDKLYSEALIARKQMLESLAEMDEDFMGKYLENEDADFSVGEVISVLRKLSLKCDVIPVVCGASLRGKGVEPILDCTLAFLPSPLDRSPSSAVNAKNKDKNIVKVVSQDSNEFCALAFKIVHDNNRGLMVYFRIYSGVLSMKKPLRNSTKGIKERINQILKVNANEYSIVQELGPGSVGCLIGLKGTQTGDTLVYEKEEYHDFTLDGLVIPPPVYSLAIEPETSTQQTDLTKALEILCVEDPSLIVEYDKESGQTLIKGIGELHLEIVMDKLKRQFNISVFASRTYIGFRETISQIDAAGLPKSFSYDKVYGTKRLFATINCTVYSLTNGETAATPGQHAPLESVVEVSKAAKDQCTNDELNSLVDGLKSAFMRGPEGFPIVGLKLVVQSVSKDSDTTPGSMRACAAALVDNLMRTDGNHTLLEPVMSLEVDVPNQFVGDVLSDLGGRRAQITEVVPNGYRNIVLGSVPLSTMLGYATAIRSMTQGEGQYSMEYKGYEPVDISLVRKLM